MTEAAKNSRRAVVDRLVKGPVGFRQRLEHLGPTFIKIGQFLALRPDLIPQEYCDELMLLMDRVQPFPYEQARTVLREELGSEPNEIFSYMNPRPMAAGSLAQTHLARLKDGTEVAVKIQRPDVHVQIERDLRRARRLARLLDISGTSLIVSPTDVVEELAGWLMQEIDFKNELRNLSRLHDLAVDSRFQKVPRPFPNLSTSRILTAEYLRGLPFSELLLAVRFGRSDVDSVALEVDRDRLAKNLLWSSLVQIFRYRFFHADLHPGNLIVLPSDVIGFVDFGLCDELDAKVRERQMRYLSAVYDADVDRMFNALTEILTPSEETDMDSFRSEFIAQISPYINRTQTDQPSYDATGSEANRSPIAQSLVGVLRAARRHKLQVPARVLSLYRALLTAETVAHQLGTTVDMRSVGREFFANLQIEEAFRAIDPDKLESTFLGMVSLLQDSPGQLHQLLTELSERRFELKVTVSEAPKVRRVRNQRLQLLITSILSVGIALLLIVPGLPKLFGASLRWPIGIVLILLYISILFQWRRLR
jgi:ubiquinone biosynthesis protein